MVIAIDVQGTVAVDATSVITKVEALLFLHA
jgi:hypothetical protein